MELKDFGRRLAKLIGAKGFTARDMSLTMGKSANYLNKIENNKTLPSMKAFFDICEILEITPQEFFDEDNRNPELLNEHIVNYKRLDDFEQTHISGIVQRLADKDK